MESNTTKLEYIENDTARRVAYEKGLKSMMKKTHEISALNGVEACTIIYGPYDQAPKVFPSTEGEARRILSEYMQKPNIKQFNQQRMLKQHVIKAEKRLKKLQRCMREMEIENLMVEILAGKPLEQVPYSDIRDLFWVIEDKMKRIQLQIDVLEGGHVSPQPRKENTCDGSEEKPGGINEEMRETMLLEMKENTSSTEK